MEKYPVIKIKDGQKYFYRFTVNQRIQHIILAVSVVVLVLTGMPLKFSDASWAPYLYSLFGGIKAAPVIHKTFGAILMILFFYHVGYLVYVIGKYHIEPAKKEKGKLSTIDKLKIIGTQGLVPNLKDAFDIRDLMKYLFYLTNKRPDGDNFTWKEKFDYWAPFWGMVIIGGSGLIMWNKEITTQIIPGGLLNFSIIAHSDEALLAALFLFIWHWYNVHFSMSVFPMGTVFLTGYLPEELMVEEHYQHYVEVMKKAGLEHEILPPHGGDHVKESQEGGASS
jgi:cytochrome b subunit of formate dehydrogenase